VRRTLASSKQSIDVKLFVEFVADLFKSYTLQGALDKLDVIECFEEPGQRLRIGEFLEKQKAIYEALGVALPSSL
jgi:hypothetical protein